MAADIMGSLSAGAYRKPGTVTSSNPDGFTETAKPGFLAGTGVNTNTPTDVYNPSEADGTDLTVDSFNPVDDHTDAPPIQPNKSVFGRDPYKHQGMPGEAYLDNSTTATNSDDEVAASDGGPATLP